MLLSIWSLLIAFFLGILFGRWYALKKVKSDLSKQQYKLIEDYNDDSTDVVYSVEKQDSSQEK